MPLPLDVRRVRREDLQEGRLDRGGMDDGELFNR
jgi:hypothetical protein